jgi:hypothetical protein
MSSQATFHNIPHFLHGRQKSGIKVQCKMAVAVQNVKSPVLFIPLFLKSAKQIVNYHSFCFSHQIDQGEETEGLEREGLEMER